MSERGAGDVDPREVVRALIEAAFAGDVETAQSWCTPDVVLTIEGTQTVRGHEGLRHVIEFNQDVSTDVSVDIHHVLGSGDVAALNRTTHLTIGGVALKVEVGSFFALRDGLVAAWTDYQDMQDVTRALGH
ncbi:limonene-1,2-epoxide hydrolase [Dietzia kunjamensis]|uniref:nuclear transport factor 2 family protein n=1 Tax=Dietzia TaxID=37914 RepID=UPI000FF5398D|nr:nuclear transport factor 2 family protein [Dietzia kunjamensis]RKE65158.1 limonene-1,2-epoxide hydrolase [Dietzia kunjamensis]USX46539.1 nuclear transport factor 2 family protein [Dietzia kunjamensis]